MPDLARMIAEQGSDLRLRQAIVVGAPAGGLCTIRFGGTDAADNIPGVHYLAAADIVNGNTVWVLQTGGALLVVGPVAGDTGWVNCSTLGYLNGWLDYDVDFVPQYRKKGNVVTMRGLIRSGTAPTAFVMPVGARPTKFQEIFSVVSNDLWGQIRVDWDGPLKVVVGSNAWVSLTGVTYRVD